MSACPFALFSRLEHDCSQVLNAYQIEFVKSGGGDWPGISPKQAAATSILRSLLKKLQPRDTSDADAAALLKFIASNERCKDWRLDIPNSKLETILGEVRRSLYNFWNVAGDPLVSHHYDVLSKARTGPGASRGAIGGDFYTKLFSSRLSMTDRALYFWYNRYISCFPEWKNAEISRILSFGEPYVVSGNRLSFVPKTAKISRSICTEPGLNMFYQLGFGAILESRLEEYYGINLSTQPFKNRELARLGSTTNRFFTIDLESASDSVSLAMLREVLPPDFYRWLTAFRSKTCEFQGNVFNLEMVSSMGNGFTFPLQTILFSAVVVACMRFRGIEILYPRGTCHGNFGVFGDDIIAPTEVWDDVVDTLKMLGFVVNATKSFREGPFRESCGGDYFLGRNIRGVYVKNLDTPQAIYSAINALNRFSSCTGLMLPRTVGYLCRKVKVLYVPRAEDLSAGIHVPLSYLKREIRDSNGSYAYRCLVSRSRSITVGLKELKIPRGERLRIWNPSGLHIAFLQGSVNAHSIGVREDNVRWVTKLRIIPNWDMIPTVHPLAGWVNWQRWDTAVHFNLFG